MNKQNFMKKANVAVMAVAAIILLIATALKIHELLTVPIVSKSFWESRLFYIIQIPLEFGLGIWLICGLFRKAGWLLAVLCFGAFIGLTTYNAAIGAESCGCFGAVKVNPWITLLAIDVPIFLLLLIFRPVGLKLFPPPWPRAAHFFATAVPTLFFIGMITPILLYVEPPEKTDTYEVVKIEDWNSEKNTTPVTSVEPNLPENQPVQVSQNKYWHMLEDIDIADSLKTGIAVVLLYHYDCPDCREVIPVYDQMNRDLAGEEAIKFAFIEVPPYGPAEESPIPPETTCLTGKLSDKTWYLTTPAVAVLVDGVSIKGWEVDVPDLNQILETVYAEN